VAMFMAPFVLSEHANADAAPTIATHTKFLI
jgi:hypothetical protein